MSCEFYWSDEIMEDLGHMQNKSKVRESCRK